MKEYAPNYESTIEIQNNEVARVWGSIPELDFDFDYVFEKLEDGQYQYDPQELTDEVVSWCNAHIDD